MEIQKIGEIVRIKENCSLLILNSSLSVMFCIVENEIGIIFI